MAIEKIETASDFEIAIGSPAALNKAIEKINELIDVVNNLDQHIDKLYDKVD